MVTTARRTRLMAASAAATLLVSLGSVTTAFADTTTSTEVTTTVPAPTTTTTPPAPTTTTVPATTTTPPAPTTTIRRTTTTKEPATTTTAPAKTSASLAWAWILGGVALVGLIAATIFGLLGANRRKAAGDAWIPTARASWENAVLARGLLNGQPTGGDVQLAKVRAQAEEAARALDRAAASAPDEPSRQDVSSVAEGLRGVLFTIEAESLLRSGPTAPTAEQLAEADLARRRRTAELDASLAHLDSATRPPVR